MILENKQKYIDMLLIFQARIRWKMAKKYKREDITLTIFISLYVTVIFLSKFQKNRFFKIGFDVIQTGCSRKKSF